MTVETLAKKVKKLEKELKQIKFPKKSFRKSFC
jgi:hypothetical protein